MTVCFKELSIFFYKSVCLALHFILFYFILLDERSLKITVLLPVVNCLLL